VDKYATGHPAGLNPPVSPLPFLYLGTGVESRFINGLDHEPKTRCLRARSRIGSWLRPLVFCRSPTIIEVGFHKFIQLESDVIRFLS
jgi:hypothetical protein